MPGGPGPDAAARSAPDRVVVVTDSTASLPPGLAASAEVLVVPLRLLAGAVVADDRDPDSAAAIEAAAHGTRLTTARPAPDRFAAAYLAAARAGARSVLSVHVAEWLSGTVSSAALAAASAPIPVRVLDAGTIGTGLGLVVLAAVAAARSGQGVDEAAETAASHAERVGSFFALDDPGALLAGGRLAPAPGAGLPGAGLPGEQPRLVSRTVLRIASGQVVTVERVRTRAAAADQLIRLAGALAAGLPSGQGADLAVEHTAAAARAAAFADRLAAAVPHARLVYVAQASMAIRAHAGLGMLGVSVAPHPAPG